MTSGGVSNIELEGCRLIICHVKPRDTSSVTETIIARGRKRIIMKDGQRQVRGGDNSSSVRAFCFCMPPAAATRRVIAALLLVFLLAPVYNIAAVAHSVVPV
jgi:hypothetical protein